MRREGKRAYKWYCVPRGKYRERNSTPIDTPQNPIVPYQSGQRDFHDRAIEHHVDPVVEIMNGEGEISVDRETAQVLPPFFSLTFDKTMHYSAPC
jgi:hypothetical protein